MSFSALVVDDELLARDELIFLLEKSGKIKIVGESASGQEALEAAERLCPDVVFLDVQMPEIDGFTVARSLIKRPDPPMIVFATAHDEYALKAFEVHAADYLLKPFDPNRVAQCVNGLERRPAATARGTLERLDHLLLQLNGLKQLRRIPLEGDGRTFLVSPSEILYASSGATDTLVMTLQGEYTTTLNLQEMEARLGPSFLRVHRQYIANMEKVREFIPYPGATAALTLGSKTQVPVARTQVKRVKEMLGID